MNRRSFLKTLASAATLTIPAPESTFAHLVFPEAYTRKVWALDKTMVPVSPSREFVAIDEQYMDEVVHELLEPGYQIMTDGSWRLYEISTFRHPLHPDHSVIRLDWEAEAEQIRDAVKMTIGDEIALPPDPTIGDLERATALMDRALSRQAAAEALRRHFSE